MTAQTSETLLIDGERLWMSERPLEPWFDLARIRSPFVATMTWNRRGYCGTWEVLSDRLYLVELSGELADGSDGNVATLFPGFCERVFAHWFTGTLEAAGGEMIDRGDFRRAPTYARTLFIDIDRGSITGRRERLNGGIANDAPAGTAQARAMPEQASRT